MLTFIKRLLTWRKPKALNDGRPDGYGTATEYVAEVVRVTQLKPHGNADKLELVEFEMATGPCSYQVVSQKGQFVPGQLVGYFSVDCIVPTDRPEFAFLLTRLDGAGKTAYRLRAARLRGVFSQGLVVPLEGERTLGQYLGSEFGVTYHAPVQPDESGPTRPSAKPRVQPLGVYEIDSLKKLPNLFGADEEVTVTEKIHGTNFRFGWVPRKFLGIRIGWKFVVGSHRVIKSGQGRDWYGEDLWTQAAYRMQLDGVTKNYKGYQFFGELYGYTYSGQKIQDLTYGRKPTEGPGLVIFDIKSPNGWLSADERIELCNSHCQLPHAPVLAHTSAYGACIPLMVEGTAYYDRTQIREGVVVEACLPRRKAKYVSQAYLTRKDA